MIKIEKNIITAIANPKINEQLKKEKYIKIIYKDLQYSEAILDVINEEQKIDFIIINEEIIKEKNLENFLKNIKKNNKIKIIIILEKENQQKEKILKKLNILYIYKKDLDVNNLKKIIFNNKNNGIQEQKISNNNLTKNEKIKNVKKEKVDKKILNQKIIIVGQNEKIKKNLVLKISKKLHRKKNKILIVNFSIYKDSIKNNLSDYFFQNKFYSSKIKLKKGKINIINNYHFLFKQNSYKNNIKNLKEISKDIDYIFVNLRFQKFLKNKKEIHENFTKNIIIIENDLLGIKEGWRFIDKLKEEQDFCKNSLHIVGKNKNKETIDKGIIDEIFQTKLNQKSFEFINTKKLLKKIEE